MNQLFDFNLFIAMKILAGTFSFVKCIVSIEYIEKHCGNFELTLGTLIVTNIIHNRKYSFRTLVIKYGLKFFQNFNSMKSSSTRNHIH